MTHLCHTRALALLIQLGLALALASLALPARAAAPLQVIGTSTERLEVEVHKGTLLRLVEPASAVFVADPEIADVVVKSPTLIYLVAKRAGETSFFSVDGQETVLANVRVVATHNISGLSSALRTLLPDAFVEARSMPGAVVLTGAVTSATEAEEARRVALSYIAEDERVVNQLHVVGPNQVNLRVRVAEVSRELLKRFGINWEALADVGNFTFGLATGTLRTPAGSVIGSTNITNTLSGAYSSTNIDLNGVIDALEEEGLIRLLAEPNLTAISGEPATFLAGGEFPIPIADGDGDVTVEFKQFGVALGFTPTVLGPNRMSLKVNPEVSALSAAGAVTINGFNIPALRTRRADTMVELASGQSIAIAGLLQSDTNTDLSKYPGLGDLPIIGALFRSREFERNETELVIIVTPYLVRPVTATAMATPIDGFRDTSDIDQIVHGRNYKQQLPRRAGGPHHPSANQLIGPAGFMLD